MLVGATSDKLLVYSMIEIVFEDQKIIKMPAPRTKKEVKGILGGFNYIGRFIARLTTSCEPLLKMLRKNTTIVLNEDCQ